MKTIDAEANSPEPTSPDAASPATTKTRRSGAADLERPLWLDRSGVTALA